MITRIRDQEYALLARILGVPLGHAALVPLLALIDGLNVAMCAPEHPMPVPRARDVLRMHIGADSTLGSGTIRRSP